MTRDAGTVLIVGAEPGKLVAIARSLRRAGVRCIAATPRSQSMRVSSRAIASTVRLHGDLSEQAEALARLARTEDARWVVPTSDRALQIVCAAYDELSRFCAVGAPPPAIARRVLDKRELLEAVRAAGVAAPEPVTIARAGDLDSALRLMRFPIVARPRETAKNGGQDLDTRIFASADELRSVFATQTRFGAGLIFHSYHAGQSVGVDVLLAKGEVVASFQHRRLSASARSGRVWAVSVSEAVDAELLERATRVLRALEWDGVASVEFRREGETGEASVVDVSGHFWSSLPLDIAAGVDFPLYAWQLSQEITPAPPASYRLGLRARWSAGSLARAGAALTDSVQTHAPVRSALRQLVADIAPGTRSAMWSWSDPVPALQEVAQAQKRWATDAAKLAVRATVPESLLSIAKDSRNLVTERRGTYVKRRLMRMLGAEPAVSLPRPANSVLFVCHGNIMRSAAAAGFLRDELRAAGISGVKIASAGTHAHDGRPADARAQDAARQLGLSLREHAATRLTTRLVAEYDVIFAMDDLNYVNILETFPESRRKLLLFGGMTPSGSYRAHEIADPYMTSASEVSATIAVIKGYVANLARALAAARR